MSQKRAIKAGFDGVELHGAHGFLLQNSSPPLFNQSVMTDGEEILKDVCASRWPYYRSKNVVYEYATKPFAIGYRISPEESVTGACG